MSFQHEAMLYAGREQFVSDTASFIREGLAADEPTLVMVTADKIGWLRDELNGEAAGVEFADMGEVGQNPGRIIPAWREFAERNAGRPMRGVGEPIWADRDPSALVECQHHESLLNAAFADAADFRLICPYDTEALPESVIAEARRSHPTMVDHGEASISGDYRGDDHAAYAFGDRLPDPPAVRHVLRFETFTLSAVRQFTERQAARAGVSRVKKDELVLAVNEVASNSVRHGGGHGILRSWRGGDSLIFEVSDEGRIDEPLVGRRRPPAGEVGGTGLWIVNQVCELVQVRSSASGTVVRLHAALG
jgi:anti-sigma regulatory factor (Ser/Thr protein kinase)